jgi:hypothetical protein
MFLFKLSSEDIINLDNVAIIELTRIELIDKTKIDITEDDYERLNSLSYYAGEELKEVRLENKGMKDRANNLPMDVHSRDDVAAYILTGKKK